MKIKFFINEFIKGTSWYRSIFNDARRILDAPYNLDIINFGSNPAKFDINYSEATIRGYNFAVGPQCMKYDYKLLQHYSNHLSPMVNVYYYYYYFVLLVFVKTTII